MILCNCDNFCQTFLYILETKFFCPVQLCTLLAVPIAVVPLPRSHYNGTSRAVCLHDRCYSSPGSFRCLGVSVGYPYCSFRRRVSLLIALCCFLPSHSAIRFAISPYLGLHRLSFCGMIGYPAPARLFSLAPSLTPHAPSDLGISVSFNCRVGFCSFSSPSPLQFTLFYIA